MVTEPGQPEMASEPNQRGVQHEARHIAITTGAQFVQSVAAEIFKQTIVANAAGVAAILAYLANRKVQEPVLLVWSAGFFLSGVALGLFACLLTYTQANAVLKKMMKATIHGQSFRLGFVHTWMGRLGVFFCWLGVVAFIGGASFAALGLYEPLLENITTFSESEVQESGEILETAVL